MSAYFHSYLCGREAAEWLIFMKKTIAIAANANMVGGVEEALIQMLKNFDYDSYDVVLYGDFLPEYRDRIPASIRIIQPEPMTVSAVVKHLFRKRSPFSIIPYLISYGICAFGYRLRKKGLQFFHSTRSYHFYPKLSNEKYDAVISYTCLLSSCVGNALYRLKTNKRILWVHGNIDHGPKLNQRVDANLYSHFDKVFCVSEATRKAFRNRFTISGNRSQVLYNLIDVEQIRRSSCEPTDIELASPTLVTVGRLSEEKGQMMIPGIVRKLLDAGYCIFWYLIGDGPDRGRIEEEIETYGVADHVILLGTKSNPYPYIKNCDVYVQTSYTEGYCTTTNEAKILQRPVITTDAPGMDEQFVSGTNGLIVEKNPQSLFAGIQQLLDRPELRHRFVSNLETTPNDNVEELHKLYGAIAHDSETGGPI